MGNRNGGTHECDDGDDNGLLSSSLGDDHLAASSHLSARWVAGSWSRG